MAKTKSIFRKLTKEELIHLIEFGLVNDPIKKFKKTREKQIESVAANPNRIPCFECQQIAKKLGLEK